MVNKYHKMFSKPKGNATNWAAYSAAKSVYDIGIATNPWISEKTTYATQKSTDGGAAFATSGAR